MCTHGASMSGPWEWLGPLAPLFAHLHPGAQKPAESAPACDQAPADHGRLARGVSDAIPWYRPFYWSPTTDCEAQEALQNVLPLIGCPATTKRTRVPYAHDPEPSYVQSITVRAVDAGYAGSEPPLAVVILPGYDAGSMFYFRQYAPVALLGCDVHAVDLLSHGLSSRPQFAGKTREEGEAFYTDALQAWAEAEGLERYVLIGHSFGGYVAACWALAHPARVVRLVLVGSAGMEAQNRACLGPKGTPWGLEGPALDAFNALWYAIQPQAVVRMAGPLGPSIAADYIQRKFGPRSAGGHLSNAEAAGLEKYLFHCLAGGGRGAVAHPPPHHALFFGPGALCYAPLAGRLDQLQRPLSLIYGLYDWMDWRDGEKVRGQLSRASEMSLVENAGHHVYLENPEGFRDALAHALSSHLPGGGAEGAARWAVEEFPSGVCDATAAARGATGAAHGAPLPPPRLFHGVCRYPSGFEDAAADEELELLLAQVEADVAAEQGGEAHGPRPFSDRTKNYGVCAR